MAQLGFGLAAVLFFLCLHLLFIGIGRPFVEFFRHFRVSFHPRVSMILGVALVGLVTSILYRLGLSLKSVNVLWTFLGAAGWAWILVRRVPLGALTEWLVYIGVAGLALLPMLMGGFQFAFLQGNHWDTFGYLESALVYARQGFRVIESWSSEQLLENPLFEAPRGNLGVRPSVHILYGMLSLWFEHFSSQIHLAFLTFLSCQMYFALLEFASRVHSGQGRTRTVIAAAYVSSFWSQWTLDINAWSHIAALPIAVVLTGVLIDFLRSRPAVEENKNFWIFFLPMSGLLYLYPELFMFYGGAWGLLILWAVWIKGRERKNLSSFIGVFFAVLATGAILYDGVLKCLFLQTRFVVTTRVAWASYFFAFLEGRDGSSTVWEAVVGGLPGLLGLYFLSPGEDLPEPMRMVAKGAFFLFSLFCIWSIGKWLHHRWRHRDQYPADGDTLLGVLFVVFLFELLVFALINRYWAMGKAYSYIFPLFWAMIPLFWKLENRGTQILLGAVLVLHFSSGVSRVHGAMNEDGIHYDPPYPSHQASPLKSVRWDIDRLYVEASKCRMVTVGLEDEWLQRPLFHALYSWNIPFWLEKPIRGSFGQDVVMGPMVIPAGGPPDCKVLLKESHFRVVSLPPVTE